ncbi:involucrin-like [Medicago truncatula]|nr:involucrin-like [Medicago truncatula]
MTLLFRLGSAKEVAFPQQIVFNQIALRLSDMLISSLEFKYQHQHATNDPQRLQEEKAFIKKVYAELDEEKKKTLKRQKKIEDKMTSLKEKQEKIKKELEQLKPKSLQLATTLKKINIKRTSLYTDLTRIDDELKPLLDQTPYLEIDFQREWEQIRASIEQTMASIHFPSIESSRPDVVEQQIAHIVEKSETALAEQPKVPQVGEVAIEENRLEDISTVSRPSLHQDEPSRPDVVEQQIVHIVENSKTTLIEHPEVPQVGEVAIEESRLEDISTVSRPSLHQDEPSRPDVVEQQIVHIVENSKTTLIEHPEVPQVGEVAIEESRLEDISTVSRPSLHQDEPSRPDVVEQQIVHVVENSETTLIEHLEVPQVGEVAIEENRLEDISTVSRPSLHQDEPSRPDVVEQQIVHAVENSETTLIEHLEVPQVGEVAIEENRLEDISTVSRPSLHQDEPSRPDVVEQQIVHIVENSETTLIEHLEVPQVGEVAIEENRLEDISTVSIPSLHQDELSRLDVVEQQIVHIVENSETTLIEHPEVPQVREVAIEENRLEDISTVSSPSLHQDE